ncbi:ras-related protein RABC1-like [Gossypium australe]|uniref:Ras-related protein RABC1-like n=1 Tax=Gossypium australe TaxID=47621 RepID=A0A5B6WEB4_9ROSI|nr:ras-related protein RABC1-like [Gossypium australe]
MLKVNAHYSFSALIAVLAISYIDRFLLSFRFQSDVQKNGGSSEQRKIKNGGNKGGVEGEMMNSSEGENHIIEANPTFPRPNAPLGAKSEESERVVTKKEGINFAREYGCLFIECSAKTRVNVQQCFDELVLKILDTPSLLAEGSKGGKKNIFKQKPPQPDASASRCC